MIVTPSQFLATSAQGAAQLTWAPVPTAVSYSVYRSPDGVTFSSLGTSVLPVYNDTTGTVDVVYYYYITAYDGTSTSQPTPTLTAMALLPGQNTVSNIVLMAQQRCDRVNSNFITPQEWISMASQSYKELYDILVQKFGDDYFVAKPYTYTTSGTINSNTGASTYPLPNDFYKMLGVEVALNPQDPNSWVSLRKFEFIQRNLWNYPNVYTFYGITNLRYRINGTNLLIVPIPSSGQTIRIWYAPRPNQLLNPTDLVDGISGWEEYMIADMCIKALAKEESDTSVFMAQKQALLKRIEEAGENRDIGEPETVSDSRRRNFAWSDGGSDGNQGGWYGS